jgi:hypothetical protein
MLESMLGDRDTINMLDELFGRARGTRRSVRSIESGVEDIHHRFEVVKALIHGEDGYETMAQAMVLKLSEGEVTPEKLKERRDLTTLDGRLTLAFWLLPKGWTESAADFVERLGAACSLTLSKWEPTTAQIRDLPEICLTIMGSKPPSIAMKDFRFVMGKLGLDAVTIDKLISKAATDAWDQYIRHNGMDTEESSRGHIPFRLLGDWLEMKKQEALGDLDFSSTDAPADEDEATDTPKDDAPTAETPEPEKAPA